MPKAKRKSKASTAATRRVAVQRIVSRLFYVCVPNKEGDRILYCVPVWVDCKVEDGVEILMPSSHDKIKEVKRQQIGWRDAHDIQSSDAATKLLTEALPV